VKDCLGLVLTAKSRGVKVVMSPVLWSDWRRALFAEGVRQKTDLFLRHFSKVVFPAFPSARRRLLLASDLLFPNSKTECKHIARLFAVPASKMRVVPNGVERRFADADPSLFREKYGKEPFILGVGRLEPRKNQLNLVKALKGSGQKLILVGSPVTGYEAYARECQETGKGFTVFLPTLRHDDPMLASAYAACSVFALQGWFETPGLAALEAALAGARLAVTSGGSTREYFGDAVEYLDPSSPADIRRKIDAASRRTPDPALRERILSHFTWEAVARETLSGYRKALDGI
jgi:glycosyltransferase involved in cell wall biosynthesis